jgi:Fe-S-cluster-containing hydrogenase component 2
MSDFVVHKSWRTAGIFARHYGVEVTNLHFQPGKGTTVKLADGRVGAGSCLGCESAPCIEKDESELSLPGALNAFPGDPNRDVCPTKAIQLDSNSLTAVVTESACIGCGLCIARCPYGAISLADGQKAQINVNDPDKLIVATAWKGEHSSPDRVGRIAMLNAPAARNFPITVGALEDAQSNLMVRNLLSEIGLNARTRRRGDPNMRIDAVGFSRSERPFVAEIEFGPGVLESPRALLEDVAVLHSRYGYSVDGVDPVSIILAFPNVRSEYYQVIRDIEKVTGLCCRSITIGALIAILWRFGKLNGFTGKEFAVTDGTINIANSLGLDDQEQFEPYPGAFRPAK